MPFVKSLRDVRVATLSGHMIPVEAMRPTFVPQAVLADAQRAGCVTCDEHGKIVLEDGLQSAALHEDKDEIPFLPPEDREDPAKRKRVIKLAVLKCFKKNQREDFGTNGVPKAGVVSRMIGFQVTGAEIADVTESLKSVDE
jgi:hypothetical protein